MTNQLQLILTGAVGEPLGKGPRKEPSSGIGATDVKSPTPFQLPSWDTVTAWGETPSHPPRWIASSAAALVDFDGDVVMLPSSLNLPPRGCISSNRVHADMRSDWYPRVYRKRHRRRLNGNNGSWTNTDDVNGGRPRARRGGDTYVTEAFIPKCEEARFCYAPTHYHKERHTPASNGARGHAERAQKRGEQVKRPNVFKRCKSDDPAVCDDDTHFHPKKAQRGGSLEVVDESLPKIAQGLQKDVVLVQGAKLDRYSQFGDYADDHKVDNAYVPPPIAEKKEDFYCIVDDCYYVLESEEDFLTHVAQSHGDIRWCSNPLCYEIDCQTHSQRLVAISRTLGKAFSPPVYDPELKHNPEAVPDKQKPSGEGAARSYPKPPKPAGPPPLPPSPIVVVGLPPAPEVPQVRQPVQPQVQQQVRVHPASGEDQVEKKLVASPPAPVQPSPAESKKESPADQMAARINAMRVPGNGGFASIQVNLYSDKSIEACLSNLSRAKDWCKTHIVPFMRTGQSIVTNSPSQFVRQEVAELTETKSTSWTWAWNRRVGNWWENAFGMHEGPPHSTRQHTQKLVYLVPSYQSYRQVPVFLGMLELLNDTSITVIKQLHQREGIIFEGGSYQVQNTLMGAIRTTMMSIEGHMNFKQVDSEIFANTLRFFLQQFVLERLLDAGASLRTGKVAPPFQARGQSSTHSRGLGPTVLGQ